MAVDNKGNLITRRAFAGEDGERSHRMKRLRDIVNKAMSTTYQMTEEVGEFGSGTPSPLHMVCEQVRSCEEFDRQEQCEISTAEEVARYPLIFLRQLRGEHAAEADTIHKLNFLLKNASDANYLLKGRELVSLTPAELKEFEQKMMNVSAAAQGLGEQAGDLTRAAERNFPGAPVQRERVYRRAEESLVG